MATNLVIRPERPSDRVAIARVVADAFGSSAEAELVERIRSSPEYVAEMALIAGLDGEVVGHVMISGAAVRNHAGEHPITMLSPLAVAPGHQGRGIGGALVRAVTCVADERGEPFVVLEGNPAYYARFGFEPAAAHGLSMPIPEWAPSDAAQLLRLSAFRNDDVRLVGDVVYPAAFDGLE